MTRASAQTYQRPTVDHAAAMAMLLRQEQTHRNSVTSAVAGGAVLCLLMVLVAAVLYCVVSLFSTIGGWGFAVTYLIVGAVVLPVLFVVAAKFQPMPADPAGGGLLSDRGRDEDHPLRVLGERVNLGPRLVLWGIDQARFKRSAFGPLEHDRLAAALVTLAAADGGLSPAKLLLPGESADQLQPLLAVLLHHEWADLSKSADRVWLTTEGKKKLGLVA